MTNAYQQQHTEQLDRILAAIPKGTAKGLQQFIERFYAKVPVSDLRHYEAPRAVALAASAYDFAAERTPGAPKIRVFTPEAMLHGYEGRYTVIELLNDDMPFLVDSLSAELTSHGFTLRETIHPILHVRRDDRGRLREVLADGQACASESFIHFEISGLPEGVTPDDLQADLESVLAHIRASVTDWRRITDKATACILSLEQARPFFAAEAVSEVEDFIRWLLSRNFIFLGYAEYDFYDARGKEQLAVVEGSRLGVLRLTDEASPSGLEALPAESRHFLLVPQLIEITKSNRRSPVHRPIPMDYIGLKRFDEKGRVVGEFRFLGLFTSNVYYQSAEAIPLVRRKIDHVLKRSTFDPASHDGKALKAILEFLPRDEVFQMADDELFDTALGILALEAKPGVRIFARRDAFERFVSAMVFVPRERFSTQLRHQIQGMMEKAYNGTTTAFSTQITEAPLARLHVIIRTVPGEIPQVDHEAIETAIARLAYQWSEALMDALVARHGEALAEKRLRSYAGAFPQNYIDRYDAMSAVHDIQRIEESLTASGLALELYRLKSEGDGFLHLKIYNPNEEIALSDILPVLENAGFRAIEEQPFAINVQGGVGTVWIRDFKLQAPAMHGTLEELKPLLEEALHRVWQGEMESDRFGALTLRAGLNWRQVTLLRAYARYLRQIGFAYPQTTIEQALNQHPGLAALIAQLFEARFALKAKKGAEEKLRAQIEEALALVSGVVEDRILRRYVELIGATLRTNYFQTILPSPPGAGQGGGILCEDGTKHAPLPASPLWGEEKYKPVLSFKFDSQAVPELPLPRPYAEIFVYGVRVEGIHLRGGKVARGGLRWSDRHDDFRTEILGLMKAQMVKNSVIVPVGSKGGFVVKRPPAAREAYLDEGVACYRMYLRGLLDLTDNIVGGAVVPPSQVTRQDGDDPYLVVAADKGTASFSDIANGVSAEYGFWLGDAFASGGSVGYDHKKMAITARGAWVSVTRHFREAGLDIALQDFTVAGIGDMAGDVFGNGMLLSEHIRLVAAFNHLHIFLDPSPDAAASFAERQRLFNLPRSTWKDYDARLISKGGGIYERSAKTIPVSKEVQAALGITGKASLTPDELMRAILLAPVDLLWNGGIGTYVKAEEETHEQVGDRANNALRVNGKELRCKVVGEGGNLGFTQKGRIEYARSGGRINTDAIDNSAGVDCSDHEVNIKIAFARELGDGSLTVEERNRTLGEMTDEVARLVLKDNILQTQALSVAEAQGFGQLESQLRLMQRLERQGMLDRAVEYLPTDKQLSEMKAARRGLTRPELAVLLAYSKMVIYRELLESGLPDEPYFAGDLMRYFPIPMQKESAEAIAAHPLRREIIATVVTNSLVNRGGITFFFDISQDLGVSARNIAAAYALARDAFGLRGLWKAIESCESAAPAVLSRMLARTAAFLERATLWPLRNLPLPLDIEGIAQRIAPGIAELAAQGRDLQTDASRQASDGLRAELLNAGVPQELAEQVVGLELLESAFDILLVAHKSSLPVAEVGRVYFALGERANLGWLRATASQIAAATHWERLAVQAIIGDLYDEQRRLTVLAFEAGGKSGDAVEGWMLANAGEMGRFAQFIGELKAGEQPDLARLMVALRHVRMLGGI